MGAAEFKIVLKKLRMEKGWTQKELSEKIGVSKTAVASWEQGARIPKVDTLEDLADLFNVDMNYLLGETDKTTKIPHPYDEIEEYLEILHKDPQYRVLLSRSAKLDKEALDNLVNFIKTLTPDE